MLARFVVMISYRLTGFRSVHRFLQQHPLLAQACGLPPGQVPSDRTFSRRFQQLDGVLLDATAQVLRRLTSRRLLRWSLLVIDATPLRAKGRRPPGPRADRRTTDKTARWQIRLTTPHIRHRAARASAARREPYLRSPRGRWLLKRRADIERFFSQDKGIFVLDPLPVVGLPRVRTYVSLALLTYLVGVAYNGTAHRPLRALKSLVA